MSQTAPFDRRFDRRRPEFIEGLTTALKPLIGAAVVDRRFCEDLLVCRFCLSRGRKVLDHGC